MPISPDIQRSLFRNVENMLRIAIVVYAKGEMQIFSDMVINAAELVKTIPPESVITPEMTGEE